MYFYCSLPVVDNGCYSSPFRMAVWTDSNERSNHRRRDTKFVSLYCWWSCFFSSSSLILSPLLHHPPRYLANQQMTVGNGKGHEEKRKEQNCEWGRRRFKYNFQLSRVDWSKVIGQRLHMILCSSSYLQLVDSFQLSAGWRSLLLSTRVVENSFS